MAKAEWGHARGKWCSYKRAAFIICTINIAVALFVLHSLYTSLYIYPVNDSPKGFRYTLDQIRKMEESIRIRKESEPIELVKLVGKIKEEVINEERTVDLPLHLKQKITDEILGRLKGSNANMTASEQREVVESWRKEKLEEVIQLSQGETFNSVIPTEEAGMLARALESDWDQLSEEIGLWIPVEIVNKENDDKPEDAEELDDEVLPGRPLPPECNVELHTDYGGAAVRWGLTHLKESAYDCCQACLNQARRAKPDETKCNIWVYCPTETACYSPDKYTHKSGECWLKYAKKPRLNFKDRYSESFRNKHPKAPLIVPWVSGVVST